MIEKFKPNVHPHTTLSCDTLIKTLSSQRPYYGAYFSGYYSQSQNTWKIYTLNSDSPTGGTYVPISQECIEYWIPMENDYIKES